MGLQEIKSDILNEAQQKADEIEKEAEEERERIIEEAKKEAEEIRQEYEEQLEEEKENLRKQAFSNARMKAKESKLNAKEEYLSKVFIEFRKELEELTGKERESYVKNCLEKVEFDVGKVIGGEEFEESVDRDFEEKDVAGVIVVSEDDTRRQDFTFDKIVQQFKNQHRKQVADKLFEE